MAITGDALLITLRYTVLGQLCQTGQYYTPGGATFITANADGVGEAWWNHVSDAWRALAVDRPDEIQFNSVVVEEFNGSGGLGEFAIPALERTGTRPGGGVAQLLAAFNAVGVRLTVPTRATRPGQKRFPFLTESDVEGNDVDPNFLDLVEAVVAHYDQTLTLGAPLALGTLTPIIIHYAPAPPHAEVSRQDVTGHVINPFLTTQVSRRYGHGS